MIIRIQVTSYNGAPPSQPLVAEFDEFGGNIGRAEGNALILHDPMRVISRRHASVEFRDGSYFIRNLGTAIPVYVNGQSLGNGRDAAITAGDEIHIGGYMMTVASAEKPALADGSSNSLATPKDDPLALFGGQSDNNSIDIFAPLPRLQPQSASSLTANNAKPLGDLRAPSSSPAYSGIIPPDFDPFAGPPLVHQSHPVYVPSQAPPSSDILGLEFVPSVSPSIDKLFGLNSEGNSDPFASGAPLAPPLNAPGTDGVDPLAILGGLSGQKPPADRVQRDDVLELHGSFHPPNVKPDHSMRAVLPAAPQAGSVSSSEPYGLVLSWENKESAQESGELKSVIVPSPKTEPRETARDQGDQQLINRKETEFRDIDFPAADGKPAVGHAGMPIDISSTQKSVANHDELLRAFLAGAGVPDLALPKELTPEFMGTLGQLLRESTQGTLNLLLARTRTKIEIRTTDLTVIVPRENNPLKFSPSVEVALAHLLTPQGRGFMTPLQAMRDAHSDLCSHQLAIMAGMRAALTGVLECFNPGQLEQRLTQKTVIDSLLPINRKAKLWDLFTERYNDISAEVEEDFRVLFSKEFRRAYEAQIAKLEQDDEDMKR